MSILKLFGLGVKNTVKVLGKNAVSTNEVMAGKVSIPGWDLKALQKSPAIDEFISQTAKQNATIIGDNIMRSKGGSMPLRVITKRMKNGRTIAQAFGPGGCLEAKEVIGKGYRAYSSGAAEKGVFALLRSDGSGAIRAYCPGTPIKRIAPGTVPAKNLLFKNADGLTAFANANNEKYQTLKSLGLVY